MRFRKDAGLDQFLWVETNHRTDGYGGSLEARIRFPAEVVAAAVDGAAWSGAALVVVLAHGAAVPDDLPGDATVMGAPAGDPDAAFATLVGGYVAALDAGLDAATAFRDTLATSGAWTAVD